MEEQVFPGSDYGAVVQRCRGLDLDSVSSDVRGEVPEAPPPLFFTFCAWFYAWQRPGGPVGGAQEHLAA